MRYNNCSTFDVLTGVEEVHISYKKKNFYTVKYTFDV